MVPSRKAVCWRLCGVCGTREDPREQPGYVIVLTKKLERMVLDRPIEFYFQPPYDIAETWKRVLADYLFVFIDS